MNTIILRKIWKLRNKFRDNPTANEQLNNILWYSFPIVYTKFNEQKRTLYDVYNENKRFYNAVSYAKKMSECKAFDYVLITLTFSNDSLEFQCEKTRKQYVSRFLNANTVDYIACIDYGKKNQREHYHAIALVEPMAVYLDKGKHYKFYNEWNGGFHLVTQIESNNSDSAVRYAMKAVRYAFKSGNKVFHKRKPYKSKLHFDYAHDWCEFNSDEVFLCGLV